MFKGTLGIGAALAVGLASAAALAAGPVAYKVVDGEIPQPLTAEAGNADRGRAVMIDRKLGNCLACHQVSAIPEQPFHGEVGPPLDGAADRWSEGQLRLIVANSKALFEGTIMPAFHRTEGLHRVAKKFEGKTIISAQDVEDIVAYLKTLKEQ